MKVEIKVEGEKDLIARFETVRKGLDFRELGTWDAVASEFRRIEAEQFAGEGVGPSGKWKALSAGYAVQKVQKWGDQPTLQASGRLMRSLTSHSDDSVLEKTASELTIGTTVPYAKYHQSKEARKRLPRRPVVDLSEQQVGRLSNVIAKKMKQLVANAKLRDLRGF